MCKSSRNRAAGEFCAGGASSYTLKPHQSDEHGCEVCGIHHNYAQHGALGGADMYAHSELRARMDYASPYSPAAASSRLGDVERRAVLAELASIHEEAAGLGELHIHRDGLVSLGQSFMDGHGPDVDMKMIASHATAKTAAAAAPPPPLTLDDVVEGQFATCRAPTACGQGCSAAVDAAIARCGEWAQSPGALRRIAAAAGAEELKSSCAAALIGSKQACSEDASEVGPGK
jgi:hypothetical protein